MLRKMMTTASSPCHMLSIDGEDEAEENNEHSFYYCESANCALMKNILE